MRKHSFTLAETLVTLTILGIIMALVMPLINKAKPDKDIIIFKKALYTLQSAVGNATEVLISDGASSSEIWASSIAISNSVNEDAASGFCSRIAATLNTAKEKCSIAAGSSSYSNPQIITTDGIRFWNLPAEGVTFSTSGYKTICMDRTLTTKELKTLNAVRVTDSYSHATYNSCYTNSGVSDVNSIGLPVAVRWDGKVYLPSNTGKFYYPEYLVEKSFEVKKD